MPRPGLRLALLTLLACLTCSLLPARPRSILLVSVDTLRADRLGAYGSPLGLTPHLDALAERSLVFEHAYAPAPFTLPSVSAMLTGIHPDELGVRSNAAVLAPGLPTLASQLAQGGWRTGAVVSNFVLRGRSGVGQGFELWDDQLADRERVRGVPEREARATTAAALEIAQQLADGGEPFFLWVHYQDPHGPYTPPPGYREARLAEGPPDSRRLPVAGDDRGLGGIPPYQLVEGQRDAAFYRAGYDAEVVHVDEQIGRLLAEGPFSEAIVLFAADHGEGLGERDLWFSHGEHLDEAMLRVPLLLKVPGRAPGVRRDLVSLLDLAPTLLALAGLPASEHVRGRDLLAAGAERVEAPLLATTFLESTVPRLALLEGGYRLVLGLRAGAVQTRELYRLGDDASDLAPERPEQAQSMQRRLAELRAELRRPRSRRQQLGDEEREALRALGYGSDAETGER